MTVLPFVTVILMVLALYNTTFFSSHAHFLNETTLYLDQHRADLRTRNQLEIDRYQRLEPRKNPSKGHRQPPTYQRPPAGCYPNKSKINLFHLENPVIFETAVRLVKRLYIREDARKILHRVKKKLPKTHDFFDLFPYEMARGTSTNIPPIASFFCFDTKREPIYFLHASKEVMEAYFGEALAGRIFALEQEIGHTLSQEQLAKLTPKIEGLSFSAKHDLVDVERSKEGVSLIERKRKSS